MRYVLILLLLPGCVGLTPGFGGKTNYSVLFLDEVEGQKTVFKSDISAPAGSDLEQLSGAEYFWEGGHFRVNGDSIVNTQGQAAMMTEYTQLQKELIETTIHSTVTALAPFLGQYLRTRENEAVTRRESIEGQGE